MAHLYLEEIARCLTPGEIAERLYENSFETVNDLEELILDNLEIFDDILVHHYEEED